MLIMYNNIWEKHLPKLSLNIDFVIQNLDQNRDKCKIH